MRGQRPPPHRLGGRLRTALVLTGLVLAIELGAGVWAHSLALLSDAGHELADVVSIGLALIAFEVSSRPADARRTYGYHRAGILAALANSAILVVVLGAILAEAVRRLAHPEPVQGGVVVAAAGVGLLLNAYLVLGLRRGCPDPNIRAAMWHAAGDLLGAAGVMVSGAVILATGFLYADPAASLAIAALVGWGAVRIGLETVHVLLEGTPRGIDLKLVEGAIEESPGIASVHDLHVWSIAPDQAALSCHVVVVGDSLAGGEGLVEDLDARIRGFGIEHTTVQLECGDRCPSDLAGAAHGGRRRPRSRDEGALLAQDPPRHGHG